MTAAQFFRWVWRVNGVVLFLVGLPSLGLLGHVAVDIARGFMGRREVHGVVNVAGQQVARSEFQYGDFDRVEGAPVLRAPLRSVQEYPYVSGTKRAESTRNYLFYDYSTGKAHWLVDGDERLFLLGVALALPEGRGGSPPTLAFLYRVVDADTNHDSRLTESDLSSLAISDPAGLDYEVLVKNVDEVLGHEVVSPSTALVFYVSDKTLRVAEIDLAQRRLARDGPLSAVPQAQK